MNNNDLIKENEEFKKMLVKLKKEKESMKPFLCSDPKCKERKFRVFVNVEE